jgi:hypothetical protein
MVLIVGRQREGIVGPALSVRRAHGRAEQRHNRARPATSGDPNSSADETWGSRDAAPTRGRDGSVQCTGTDVDAPDTSRGQPDSRIPCPLRQWSLHSLVSAYCPVIPLSQAPPVARRDARRGASAGDFQAVPLQCVSPLHGPSSSPVPPDLPDQLHNAIGDFGWLDTLRRSRGRFPVADIAGRTPRHRNSHRSSRGARSASYSHRGRRR